MANNGTNETLLNIYGQPVPFNLTLYNDPTLCSLSTCPVDWASTRYVPSLGGNAFFLAFFTACLVAQVALGVVYKTWPFLVAWIFGLALEIVGYAGRIMMHNNLFDSNPFLIYLICLTIAPAFLSAGIYLCLSRIIIVYGESLARFRPKTYTIIFVCSDIFALVLQALGGALADTADSGSSLQQTGINIMIAGLSFQVVSLFIFIALCMDFAWRVMKRGVSPRPILDMFGCSNIRFQIFILALATATITIFVRSCYRVAELKSGFDGSLANNQNLFMVLEGTMVAVASLALTIFHPGPTFRHFWKVETARREIKGRSDVGSVVDSGLIELRK